MRKTYLPTINLWTLEGYHLALSGRLQRGQWVQCGPGKPSRFLGTSNGTIHAIHEAGDSGAQCRRFYNICAYDRNANDLLMGRITTAQWRKRLDEIDARHRPK